MLDGGRAWRRIATLLTYPNSRAITIDYGTSGGINDSASRVENLIDGGTTTLASYSYLGINSAVEVTYPQPSTQYTLLGSSGDNNPTTGDIYWGLDLFGRIVDSRWEFSGLFRVAVRWVMTNEDILFVVSAMNRECILWWLCEM